MYNVKGNCPKYKELKKQLKEKTKIEGAKFIQKQVEMSMEKGGGWQKKLKRMMARPGEDLTPNFTLTNHREEGLTDQQSVDRINIFFSAISQEYKHLEIEDLPDRVKLKLENDGCEHPKIEEHEVFVDLKSAKMTASTPFDIPIPILKEFLPEFIAPVTAIYKEAISSHEWPQCYKQERHLPIKKTPSPDSEDDIRTLGLTAFFSKRLEAILILWIWPYIRPHLSKDQMGGIPGSSVVHYLTRLIHWILQKTDNNSKDPTAVLASLIDFSKGFNRMSPVILVTLLSYLNIPTCALRLIISYLRNRSMITTFNGSISPKQYLCGGGPQGSLLIVFLFCIQVNKAGDPCSSLPDYPIAEFGPHVKPIPLDPPLPCQRTEETEKKLYIDDLTELEAVNLTSLVPIEPFIGPLNFHERCGLALPAESSILQHKLADMQRFTEENMMMINKKKTIIMPFNFSKTRDFIPRLKLPGGCELKVIYESRLLGIIIQSDLTFSSHVSAITKKATRSFWLLLRFRDIGATISQLLTLWQEKGRSVLEFASPVFFSRLTGEQSDQIDNVQRKAFVIILGPEYVSYNSALKTLGQERLSVRRETAALTFGRKCVSNPKHADMFPLNVCVRENMRDRDELYKEYQCNTSRFYDSSLPTICRLLNQAN